MKERKERGLYSLGLGPGGVPGVTAVRVGALGRNPGGKCQATCLFGSLCSSVASLLGSRSQETTLQDLEHNPKPPSPSVLAKGTKLIVFSLLTVPLKDKTVPCLPDDHSPVRDTGMKTKEEKTQSQHNRHNYRVLWGQKGSVHSGSPF